MSDIDLFEKMTIIIILLGQRHCRHVFISIKKTVVHKQEKKFMNNEKFKFVRQVAKVDLV